MATIRGRVVATVAEWCSTPNFDTGNSLQTLWLEGPDANSVPFTPDAVGVLIGLLTTEFSKPEERDLSAWSPGAFAPGDPIDTVEDLVSAVRFSLPPVGALVHGFAGHKSGEKFLKKLAKAMESKQSPNAEKKGGKL